MRKIQFYKGAGKFERKTARLMKCFKTIYHNEIIRKKKIQINLNDQEEKLI